MTTTLKKGEIVRFALRKFAVASNATQTDLEPPSMTNGVTDLEDMLYEWKINPGDIGYLFAVGDKEPHPDDDSGLPRKYKHGVGYQLVLRMMSDYGLEPTPRQEANAAKAYDAILTDTLEIPSMRRRGDFLAGQGNRYDTFCTDRYYPDDRPETDGDVLNP